MSAIAAITIHQPWAWAIAEGHKRVENRDWAPPSEIKWLAIHAGGRPRSKVSRDPTKHTIESVSRNLADVETIVPGPAPDFDELIFGAIIAVVKIHKVTELGKSEPRSPWRTETRFGWWLGELVKLPHPIDYRGSQRLWPLPERMLPQIKHAILEDREKRQSA